MFDKLGPRKNREDPDALFFEMCAAASSAAGRNAVQKLVAAGFDINFVLPGFRHPIFRSLHHDEFSMAALLVELGTRPDHLDDDGVPVVDRIIENLQFWRDRSDDPQTKSVHRMARRRIQLLEGALRVYLP